MPPLAKLVNRARAKLIGWSVPVTEEPGAVVVLANGGVMNNVTPRSVLDVLLVQCAIHQPKKKSYAYLTFDTVEMAETVVKQINYELTNHRGDCINAFAFYVDSIPEHDQPVPCPTPRGLALHAEFITSHEESSLIKLVDAKIDATMNKRAVAHFGRHFDYATNSGSAQVKSPIPELIKSIMTRISALTGEHYDQITANCYQPGDGIPPHVDNPKSFGTSIVSLSLLSPVEFELRRDDNVFTLDLPQRSLLVLEHDSRYSWSHTIHNRQFDAGRQRQKRISLTLRRCIDNEEEAALLIERRLVMDVYDQIASDFSASRYKMWPMVEEFVKQIKPDQLMIDLGCGNGKNMAPCRRHALGLEISTGLATICRTRDLELALGDCTRTAYREAIADYVISIAVLHHMASTDRRRQALSEIARLLKKDGRAMVTSWASDQKESNYVKQTKKDEVVVTTKSNLLPIHKARTQFQSSDVLVPFKGTANGTSDDGEALHRFDRLKNEFE